MKKTKAKLNLMANYISSQEGQYLFSASEISKILAFAKTPQEKFAVTLSRQYSVDSSVTLSLMCLNSCTIINKTIYKLIKASPPAQRNMPITCLTVILSL